MAKPKRMSDIFTSSTEKDADATIATTTPPYSSDGPTLPVIGAPEGPSLAKAGEAGIAKGSKSGKKRKIQNTSASTAKTINTPSQSPPKIHPSLYEPWKLLPSELLKLLEDQARLRVLANVIPIVFSKNQNVKSGINRLKTYLGAYRDPKSTIDMPGALKQEDFVIAVSAQGEGTTKLVGIVDMARRIVAPTGKGKDDDERVEPWWLYTMLTSVEVERRVRNTGEEAQTDGEETGKTQSTQEEDDFEPMDIDGQEERIQGNQDEAKTIQKNKVPVLTVWMTRKKIPTFKNAFGEQTFMVQRMEEED